MKYVLFCRTNFTVWDLHHDTITLIEWPVTCQKLLKWEQERYEQNKHKYAEVTSSLLWIKFITRGIANMIQRIILLDKNPTDEEIREEISMILEVAAHSNSKQQ